MDILETMPLHPGARIRCATCDERIVARTARNDRPLLTLYRPKRRGWGKDRVYCSARCARRDPVLKNLRKNEGPIGENVAG